MTILAIRHISKSFENTQALDDISFEVEEGEILVLLGPSGCGKSTLLAIIAGLVAPDQGDILWNGTSLKDTPPHLREFGLMFQDFALFPHMNVYANVAFGLKMAHLDKARIDQRVQEMLHLVGLPDFSNRDVNTLSGGEQQRVALARALAPNPRLLMLDEPLGSLDRNLRERLVVELQQILKQMHQTAIYVTHDQEEAFTIADHIVVMNSGRIEQIGAPREIYADPASLFVARFLEMNNVIPGVLQNRDGIFLALTPLGNFPVESTRQGEVNLLIRPDSARLDEHGFMHLSGIVSAASFRGSKQRVTLTVNQIPLSFDFNSQVVLPKPGKQMTISLDPATAIKVFPVQ
jgi:ABC-type Fe3+/spermidine/putrescine transport system ATPase subunit